MRECVFCNIIEGKIESTLIYEDDLIQVIMDIDPVNDGHMLIIPKVHKVDLDELSISESTRIVLISRLLVKTLKQNFELDGYSIMQNGGYFNEIGHYHMHVFPRYKEDGFGWEFPDIEPKDIKEIGRNIKEKFDAINTKDK